MENTKTLWCGDNDDCGSLEVSIYEVEGNSRYMFFEVKDNTVEIYDNPITGILDDVNIDFKFGIDIEKVYMLRDFLNYALDKRVH